MFKTYIQKRMEKYVNKYFVKHPEVKLIVVTGSVGKTSTKVAIATVLSEHFKVRLHMDNHNTHMSAPLAILGIEYPKNIKKIGEWLSVFRAAKKRIKDPTDVDIIVQELGSDRIGEVPYFGTYLHPDIAVITAVSAEHMEYFNTIENVAAEELSVANFSKMALINKDDIDGVYAKYLTNSNINTYGTSATAEYHFLSANYTAKEGHIGLFIAPELPDPMPATIQLFGEHTLRPAIAAGAVALKFGMSTSEIVRGLSLIRSLPGRMNKLRGCDGSTIIDDSYNSSPLAAKSSLQELYKLSGSQRIVVFGDMNELGQTAAFEHEELGKLCDPNQLAWVITVGPQTKSFLAPAAKARGCQVKCFDDALSAGAFTKSVIESGEAILFKGSESGIFLEEAVKVVLHSTADESQLVRQSSYWMNRKNNFFSKFK
ncbi:MAG: UDP-N-acetylmuramoyl-tripeptide--D-alanyl-D-alanine ligase [Candidatus Saccharibacteria bacterium]